MAGKSFQVLNTDRAIAILEALYDRVAQFNDRVILTRTGTSARCVLISQAELEGLERAVEILSETHDGAAWRDEVLRIAGALGEVPTVTANSMS